MVIWGNQDRVTRVLSEFEDTRDLTEWFQSWKDAPDQRIS